MLYPVFFSGQWIKVNDTYLAGTPSFALWLIMWEHSKNTKQISLKREFILKKFCHCTKKSARMQWYSISTPVSARGYMVIILCQIQLNLSDMTLYGSKLVGDKCSKIRNSLHSGTVHSVIRHSVRMQETHWTVLHAMFSD